MTEKEEKEISEEYKRFWAVAEDLGEKDRAGYPLEGHETVRSRVEKHLLGMLEMYSIRYGDPEERLRIVDFLEKQIFGEGLPSSMEVPGLTLDIWRKLRHTILSGEYKDLTVREEG